MKEQFIIILNFHWFNIISWWTTYFWVWPHIELYHLASTLALYLPVLFVFESGSILTCFTLIEAKSYIVDSIDRVWPNIELIYLLLVLTMHWLILLVFESGSILTYFTFIETFIDHLFDSFNWVWLYIDSFHWFLNLTILTCFTLFQVWPYIDSYYWFLSLTLWRLISLDFSKIFRFIQIKSLFLTQKNSRVSHQKSIFESLKTIFFPHQLTWAAAYIYIHFFEQVKLFRIILFLSLINSFIVA